MDFDKKEWFEEQLAIKQKEHKDKFLNRRLEKFNTSKLLMYLILLNCTVIEVYSMWVMYHFADLSALYSLIGAVVGESLSYAVYCAKSFNESKEEAKSQLERDKFLSNIQLNNNETEDEEEY